MTPGGNSGSSPVMLAGADSTAGAPAGGPGVTAPAEEEPDCSDAISDVTTSDVRAGPATHGRTVRRRARLSCGAAIGRGTRVTLEPRVSGHVAGSALPRRGHTLPDAIRRRRRPPAPR